jgi:enterochelin esterase-like enzyme
MKNSFLHVSLRASIIAGVLLTANYMLSPSFAAASTNAIAVRSMVGKASDHKPASATTSVGYSFGLPFTGQAPAVGVLKQGASQQPAGEPKIVPPANSAPAKLNPDDVPLFPPPPADIEAYRPDIPHGKLQMISYYSKTVGTRRHMNVYTPPGYNANTKYPVLYLMHGIGGDETEWERFAKPNILLDNLLADKKAVPMIIVMPNGRAQKDDRPVGNIYAAAPAFAAFEQDLLKDVIPTIQARYSVQADQEHRALAGLSMGGGQALDFGLGHLELFAWIGAFSPAPNTYPPAQLVPDPQAARTALKLLWVSCGTNDGLFHISENLHLYLKQHNVPHVWSVSDRTHDAIEWRNNLYYFLQRVFQ